MNVFLVGLGGGLSRLMGFLRARELGEQAETHPMLFALGKEARSRSSRALKNDLTMKQSKTYISVLRLLAASPASLPSLSICWVHRGVTMSF